MRYLATTAAAAALTLGALLGTTTTATATQTDYYVSIQQCREGGGDVAMQMGGDLYCNGGKYAFWPIWG
jgi:hypothetical protein